MSALAVLAVVGAAIVIFAIGSSDDAATIEALKSATWEPVTSPSGRFAFEMPGTPERHPSEFKITDQAIPMEVLYCGDAPYSRESHGLRFTEVDVSPAIPGGDPSLLNFDALLTGTANALAQANEATATSERLESALGPAGTFSVRVEGDGEVLHSFMALRGPILVSIDVLVPIEEEQFGREVLTRAILTLRPTS